MVTPGDMAERQFYFVRAPKRVTVVIEDEVGVAAVYTAERGERLEVYATYSGAETGPDAPLMDLEVKVVGGDVTRERGRPDFWLSRADLPVRGRQAAS